MKRYLLLAAVGLAACHEEPTTFDAAAAAYQQARVDDAEAAFRRIATARGSNKEDRSRAYQQLAHIAWLVDGDADRALRYLLLAAATGEGECNTARMRARVLEESGRAAELSGTLTQLIDQCSSPDERDDADAIRLAGARSLTEQLSRASAPEAAAEKAQSLLDGISQDNRSSLEASSALLDLALLQHDAPGALDAWKSYFWLTQSDLPEALRGTHEPAVKTFTAGLGVGAPMSAKLALLDLLVRAGFARQATHFAVNEQLSQQARRNPVWARLSAYLNVRRQLEAQSVAAYRNEARGGSSASIYPLFEHGLQQLVAASGRTGDERLILEQTYNLYGQTGKTGGHPSAHYGHVIEDYEQPIQQYGHRAMVRLRILDNMISNGFETWLWDGRAATGGWTDRGPVIVQVRSEYTAAPLRAWRLFSDPSARNALTKQQTRLVKNDVNVLSRGAIGYLPGLSDRIRIQVADQVGNRVRAFAGPAGDMKRAFLQEYWRGMFQDAILTHEGRHAIDKSILCWFQRLRDSNLEYRAKLSELALADYPRMALLNIDDATTGGDSPHGTANARLLSEIASWITQHSAAVAGFDAHAPAAEQIDKLTDSQLRAIARELDPLARSSNSQ